MDPGGRVKATPVAKAVEAVVLVLPLPRHCATLEDLLLAAFVATSKSIMIVNDR